MVTLFEAAALVLLAALPMIWTVLRFLPLAILAWEFTRASQPA
ncbi:hypothetical protein [Streptomyces sp. NPDC093261]